jgi:Reverse transcriptase (RNA-dependent DNA polymerase)
MEDQTVSDDVDANSDHGDDDDNDQRTNNEYERFRVAEADGRARASQPNADRPRRTAQQCKHDDFVYTIFECMQQAAGVEPSDFAYVTAQMSAKAGLRMFGTKGADALMKELRQLIVMNVMSGCNPHELSSDQKRKSLKYLMFLKEKRCGQIKGRSCADGRKQRIYKTKAETSSPTVSIESLMLSCMIDAMEGRDIATCDIPAAFMQADIDEEIHVKFDGELVDLLLKVDPMLGQYMTIEQGKTVLYMLLNKALYGTVQASLLFWKHLSSFLINKHSYKRNPYDWCVVNKIIN